MGKRLSEKNPFLRDAEKKKRLMVSAITSSQRQEGIEISDARAEEVYRIVFEEPPVAFFRLDRKEWLQPRDAREEQFVKVLANGAAGVWFNVSRRDLLAVGGAPLSYWLPTEVLHLFRSVPALQPSLGEARQGLATANDPRFVRQRWEVLADWITPEGRWVPFAKGGDFSRFYHDLDLVVAWTKSARHEMETTGRLQNTPYYFRPGITWSYRSQRGFSPRVKPRGSIHGHVGHSFFPTKDQDAFHILGILASSAFEYLLRVYSVFGKYEIGMVKGLPVPPARDQRRQLISTLARRIHDAKAAWDEGNEISTRFKGAWLAAVLREHLERPLAEALDALLTREAAADAEIQAWYAELDGAVFDTYGLSPETRGVVVKDLGPRPPEVIWPQMEGKSTDQKRMEHVFRILSFCARRVIEGDEDGIVPLVKCSSEPLLEERVLAELEKIVGTDRLHDFEGEVASELRKKVAGYKRAESIADWLTNVYFEYHARLYKGRAIYWHVSSSQQSDPAFGVLVHYHRFGKDALRKLRGTYVRGRLDRLERDLGHARHENRADDGVELQQKMDEVRALDKKLQGLEEGEFPIRVPWNKVEEQRKGWDPNIDDGVRVNILPLQNASVLRIAKVVSAKGIDEEEE